MFWLRTERRHIRQSDNWQLCLHNLFRNPVSYCNPYLLQWILISPKMCIIYVSLNWRKRTHKWIDIHSSHLFNMKRTLNWKLLSIHDTFKLGCCHICVPINSTFKISRQIKSRQSELCKMTKTRRREKVSALGLQTIVIDLRRKKENLSFRDDVKLLHALIKI